MISKKAIHPMLRQHLFFVLLFLSLFSHVAHAQEEVQEKDSAQVETEEVVLEEIDFGQVSITDLEMKVFEKDSAAAAYVLYDDGQLKFDLERRQFFLQYHAQVKILNQDGFEFADVSLPFAGKKGLLDVKAMTHNLVDGEIRSRRVVESEMVVEEVMEKFFVKKITFPDVVVGSVIEYTYKMYSSSPFEFLPWYFQSTIPVRFSRFRMSVPGGSDLEPRIYGYNDLYYYDKKFFGPNHDLVMKDLPAFREEPYVKKIDDHYSKVAFEYVSSFAENWESLNDLILEIKGFGLTIDKLNGIKKSYPKNKGWQANLESLKDIHSYVASHFEWNGDYGLTFSDKPKKVWESNKGSSADINLTLLMFLRKTGFKADPVFVSTTDHGLINSDIPTFRQFNNLVVKVNLDDKVTLIDATNKLRPYNILPDECLNDSGLVVRSGEAEWVAMNLNKERAIQSVSIEYNVDDFGEMEGKGTIISGGSTAASLRIDIMEKSEGGTQKPQFMEDINDLDVDNVSIDGLDDPYASVKTHFSFTSDDRVEDIGGRLFFSPIVFPEAETNPFKSEKRMLAVEFAKPINRRYFFNVKIPEGYEVEEIPKEITFKLPDGGGQYSYISQTTENGVQVLVRFTINRLLFSPYEYAAIREMFNLIIGKQQEKIVLKKL